MLEFLGLYSKDFIAIDIEFLAIKLFKGLSNNNTNIPKNLKNKDKEDNRVNNKENNKENIRNNSNKDI